MQRRAEPDAARILDLQLCILQRRFVGVKGGDRQLQWKHTCRSVLRSVMDAQQTTI